MTALQTVVVCGVLLLCVSSFVCGVNLGWKAGQRDYEKKLR